MGVARAEEPGRLEEVIVTADRRESNLQQTPASITVFSARDLEDSQIDDIRDLAAYVPGLVVGGYAALGTNPISIRGIGQNPLGVGADQPVAIYRDGVYLGRAYSDVFDLADTERIEVLKAPQGTLYGRNATGGAINIISRDPTNEFETSAEFRAGNLGEILGRGLVSGPVSDKVLVQFSASEHHLDGYVTNRFDGSKAAGQNETAATAKLILLPTDRLKVSVSADASRFAVTLDPKLLTEPNQNLLSVADNYDGTEKRANWGFGITAEYELDWAKLTSITALRRAYFDDWGDEDGTAVDLLDVTPLEERQNQFSEELRIASAGSERLSWVGGASYYREHANSFSELPLLTGIGRTKLILAARNTTNSYAAYADATYEILPDLRLTVGGRYTYEDKSFTFFQTSTGAPIFVTVPQSTSGLSNDAFTPRFTADYRWTDTVMTYVSVSRGFKSGGFSGYDFLGPGTRAPAPFQPEDVWAYEGGAKADLFDRRLRLDVAAFHYDYRNLQVRLPDQFGFVSVLNAASAAIDGAELEAVLKPVADANIHLSLGHLRAQYAAFTYMSNGTLIDNKGKYLLRAPRWKGALTGEYRLALGELGSLTPRIEYLFEGHSFDNDTNDPSYGHGWVNLFNARLTFESPDRHWSGALYGENLSDKLYVPYSVAVLGSPIGSSNQPRTFGLDLRYRW